MAQVLCTLPNASEEISGVKFVSHAKGMLSEEISDDVAADFASIPGYELVSNAPAGDTKTESEADDERTALVAEAEKLGVSVKGNWGIPRLKAEIASAKAAQESKPAVEAEKAETASGEKAAAE